MLIGMQIAHELGIRNLKACEKFQLVVCQVQGTYVFHRPYLIPYYEATMQMVQKFKSFYIEHLPHRQNAHAEGLISLATSMALPPGASEKMLIFTHDLFFPDPPFEGISPLPETEAFETSTDPVSKD